jgi:branched-chain amino acid transport system ATP-binding protein
VLTFGEVIGEGTPAQVRANPEVVRAYLGDTAVAPVGAPA